MRVAVLSDIHSNRVALESVLAALQKLTSENFGFSQHDWRLWWAEQARG